LLILRSKENPHRIKINSGYSIFWGSFPPDIKLHTENILRRISPQNILRLRWTLQYIDHLYKIFKLHGRSSCVYSVLVVVKTIHVFSRTYHHVCHIYLPTVLTLASSILIRIKIHG
jgi:hypothetical protein